MEEICLFELFCSEIKFELFCSEIKCCFCSGYNPQINPCDVQLHLTV